MLAYQIVANQGEKRSLLQLSPELGIPHPLLRKVRWSTGRSQAICAVENWSRSMRLSGFIASCPRRDSFTFDCCSHLAHTLASDTVPARFATCERGNHETQTLVRQTSDSGFVHSIGTCRTSQHMVCRWCQREQREQLSNTQDCLQDHRSRHFAGFFRRFHHGRTRHL